MHTPAFLSSWEDGRCPGLIRLKYEKKELDGHIAADAAILCRDTSESGR